MNKETRLISLDTSTKCSGVATFDNCKLVDYQLFDFHKEKDVEKRIHMMGKELLSYLKTKSLILFGLNIHKDKAVMSLWLGNYVKYWEL